MIVKPGTFVTTAKASKTANHTYRLVIYRCYGPKKVHRLVCLAFHGPKPFPEAVVIHIDEDAHNNRADNLRWGTQKENLNMPKIKAWHKSRTGENNPFVKGRSK